MAKVNGKKTATLSLVDMSLANDAFSAGSGLNKLEDALIAKAKIWNDKPNAATKAAQDRVTLSLKVGLEAADYAAIGRYKLPRGMSWIGFACAQRDMKPAQRVADFDRFRNNSQSFVSALLDRTYLKSSAGTGRPKGQGKGKSSKPEDAPSAAPTVAPVPTATVEKEERPLFSPSHIPVFAGEDKKHEARQWLRGYFQFLEEACASNDEVFAKNFVNIQQTVHRLLKALEG